MGGWRAVLSTLTEGRDLTGPQAAASMGQILAGDATPAQIAAFIIALRIKGETVDEMSGMVDAMLAAASPIELPFEARDAIDIVGTGGAPSRRVHALNVSTMACFVAAGAGVKVCKHGNRKASSTSGSFDLLEALGIPLELDGPTVSLVRGPRRCRVLLRPRVPSRDAIRRAGARRARRAHGVQLPRPVVEPGQGAASGDRRERRRVWHPPSSACSKRAMRRERWWCTATTAWTS